MSIYADSFCLFYTFFRFFSDFSRFFPMPILGIPGGVRKNWHKYEKIGSPPRILGSGGAPILPTSSKKIGFKSGNDFPIQIMQFDAFMGHGYWAGIDKNIND